MTVIINELLKIYAKKEGLMRMMMMMGMIREGSNYHVYTINR